MGEEYAASNDGIKMSGILNPETQMDGCCFAIDSATAHDKSPRLGLTARAVIFGKLDTAEASISGYSGNLESLPIPIP
jgi:hypothetical protein